MQDNEKGEKMKSGNFNTQLKPNNAVADNTVVKAVFHERKFQADGIFYAIPLVDKKHYLILLYIRVNIPKCVRECSFGHSVGTDVNLKTWNVLIWGTIDDEI